MQLVSMKERARSKQEEVRQILLDTIAASSELVHKLELVDTLQRIGVDYHYRKEIDELLRDVVHDPQHEEGCDDDELYVVSLRFYLLRKHGYNVSSGKACSSKTHCNSSATTIFLDSLIINMLCL